MPRRWPRQHTWYRPGMPAWNRPTILPRLTLREWETQEHPIALSERDRDLARHLHADQRLVVDELRTGLRISATSWVGLVRFEVLEVSVIPKLAGGNLGLVQMIELTTGLSSLHRLALVMALVTIGLIWKVKKLPEPALVAIAAIIGLVAFPGMRL